LSAFERTLIYRIVSYQLVTETLDILRKQQLTF